MAQTLSKFGIGASDIGAIAGLNPHKAPIDVWRRKLGLADVHEGDSRFAYWGVNLEPVVRDEYAKRNNVQVYVPPKSLFSKEIPWARATPDGAVVEGGSWKWLVQIKTAGAQSSARWEGNAIPAEYEAGVQWEMFVCELSRCDIAVLIGGNDYQERTVERDDKVIANLIEIATDFQRCVDKRIAPPVDASESYRRHLEASMGTRNDDVTLDASPELEIAVRELRELREQSDFVGERETLLRNTITAAMLAAGATTLHTSEGKITWKASKGSNRIDWQAACDTLANMLAEATGANKERTLEHVRKAHEVQTAGARRFVVPRTWGLK